VAPSIAQVLGIKEQRGIPLTNSIKEFFRERRILLVLDNFEQVIAAAPLLTDLLTGAAELRILVTSRAALHVRGEHEFPVTPLETPDPTRLISVDRLAQCPSVALFMSRAQGG
jgi:predicted ATPase